MNYATLASAQTAPIIRELRVEQEGRVVEDRLVLGLIETTVGEPLSMVEVRETYAHLTSLNRFDDVRVYQEPLEGGIRLRYELFPLHPVDRMEFRGSLGVSEGDLRRVLVDRYGEAPAASRSGEVTDALRVVYRDRGFPSAMIASRIEETHDPDRATMIFDIQAGARASIGRVEVDEFDANDRPAPAGDIAIRRGDGYDAEAVRAALDRYTASLRERGFYEIAASHTVSFEADGTATVRVTVDRGPRVSVAFVGDTLAESDRERLVPIETERSADEDLLEDAAAAIEDYLRVQGYRDAAVTYSRDRKDTDLVITFTVKRGRRYLIEGVAIAGNNSMPTPDLMQQLPLKPAAPFVQSVLDAGVGGIRQIYRLRGFTSPMVQAVVSQVPGSEGVAQDARVNVAVNITEGVRTLVGSIALQGNTVLTEGQIRELMTTAPGRPYSEVDLVNDRDRIDLEYRNRGYDAVVVTPTATLADNGTRADIRFTITEGSQVVVDHIIIDGNTRTDSDIIERELTLRAGDPLGLNAIAESQTRLLALGLFRSVRIEAVAQGTGTRRDVLVRVEEAQPNTIDFGGGIEGGTRLRPTGEGGTAEERFEFAPRASFQIGRRNLWGKNRSINLFTRTTLRSRDVILSPAGIRLDDPLVQSGYGFNEYRALLTFREPRFMNTPAVVVLNGILDQAIRSSFNFITRQAQAEFTLPLRGRYQFSGYYSYEHTRLFDERFTEDEKPLIDRLFPQVRISEISGSIIRDTRNDALDPGAGSFVVLDNELALRALGSEVGFFKAFLQAFRYFNVPSQRRMVMAFGARLGAAQGFERIVPVLGLDGAPVIGADGRLMQNVLEDLPASERFFTGGDNTVRGFTLDRLGTPETISPTGFPLGGNGVVVLNAEARMRLFGSFGGVVFLDAGNVFLRASDIDVTRLRAASGFGVRYLSPIGPIRVDLGFKIDRRELAPGQLERRSVLHISLGQAF